MLQLRDTHKKKIAGLTEYKNLYIESELQSVDKTLCFSYPKKANFHSDIVEECYINTKENEYIVKEKNVGSEYTSFKCILNLEDLEGQPFERYASEEQTIDKALALALAGTGWIVDICNLKKKRTVRISNCSSLDIIKEIKKIYRCDLVFNTLTKTIDVYESLGEDKGAYFIDSLNLKDLSIQGNSYDYYTRIIPIGKDDLRISSINNGKDYVENYQYSNKIKTFYWKDERYTVVENLKEDASAKLDEISKPYRSYSAEIINLAKLNDKYKNILDFKLGDTITLISKENKFRDKQRIVKIIEHPDEHELDTVELANTTLSFEETQTQFQEAADTVDNITTDNGTIDGSTIDNIETKQISDFEANVIKVTNLTAVNAKIHNLEAQNVNITGKLTAVEATIGTLNSNLATIDKLTVTHSANIADLQASKASITQLEAVNATIQVLESNVGKIETLVNGNLSSENIQAGGITSDKLTIANGFIKNAMIDNLDVSKVNAGDISTNKFRITSNSGNMLIADNTIQIRDNSRVRVQIGKDASNDYNMYVWDYKGNLMFDATGLKANGIKDKIIRNDMISDNANIDGNKLDINSVVSSINNGSTTIKSSKVQLDGTNQTLDVSFNSLRTEVQGIQIGGRNLALNTNFFIEGEGYKNFDLNLDTVKTFRGKQITISLDIDLVNAGTSNTTGSRRVGSEISISFSDGSKLFIGVWEQLSNTIKSMNKRIYNTWTIPDKEIVDFGQRGIYIQGTIIGKVKAGKTKIEFGNKSTDWTPAPEDVEGDICNLKEITTTQSTNISIMQGQISTAINNTQIVKDGQTILLKDDYNRTVQTVDSMKSTIGSHTTQINQATGDITKVETRVNTVERDLNSITARVSSTETTVTTVNNVANNALTKANQGISDAAKAQSSANIANTAALSAEQLAKAMSDSKMIHIDPNFRQGYNNVSAYNNANNGNVTVTRITKVSDCPTTSTHCLEIKHIGAGSPDFGGFYQTITSRANAIFIQKFIAKLPTGYTLNTASNSMGAGYTDKWLTPNQGTGKWETYIREVRCGSTGTFSSGGHVYVSGSPTPTKSSPLVWYLAYCTCFDLTDNDETVNSLKTEVSTTTSKVSSIEASLTSITSRVSSVESTTTSINGQVSSLSTRMNSAEQKITSDAIVSTVKNHQTNGQSTFITGTVFNQTIDNFEFKFFNNTEPNMLRNSSFFKGWTYWGWNGNFEKFIYHDGGFEKGDTVRLEFTAENQGLFQRDIDCTQGVAIKVHVLSSRVIDMDIGIEGIYTKRVRINEGWNEIEVIVPPIPRVGTFIFYTKAGGPHTVYAHKFKIQTGNICTHWSCHREEIYSNTTIIDNEGIEIKHDNGSKSKFTHEAVDFFNSQGRRTLRIKDGGFNFHTWQDPAELVGFIKSSVMPSMNNYNGVTLSTYGLGDYIAIGTSSSQDEESWLNNPNIFIASHGDMGSVTKAGTWFLNEQVYSRTAINAYSGITLNPDAQYPHRIYNSVENKLCVFGDNHTTLGIKYGNENRTAIEITEDEGQVSKTYIHTWGDWDFHNYTIRNVRVSGTLQAQSSMLRSFFMVMPSQVNDTYNVMSMTDGELRYTQRKAEHITNKTLIVELPHVISENIELDYHVNISKLSWGDFRITEKTPYYFEIETNVDDFSFTYEIVAKLVEQPDAYTSIAKSQYMHQEQCENEDTEPLIVSSKDI